MRERSATSTSGAFAWWVAGGSAVLAAALTLLATRHGVIIDQDSATYLSAARNLAAGRGYQDFTGGALTTFPPLFPAVIRVGMWIWSDAVTAARYVNAAAAAASTVLAFFLIRRHARSRAVVAGATILVASSIGLLHVADKALSEPLFWMLALGYLLVVETVLSAEGRRAVVLSAVAGLLVGVAFLTRYAAFSLFLVGVGALGWAWWKRRTPGIVARLAAFAVTAAILPALWIARNAGTDNPHLLGPRVGSGTSLSGLVRETTKGVGSVFLPQRLGRLSEALFWGLLVVAIVGAWGLRHVRSGQSAPKTTLVPVCLFVVVYVVFIAYTNAMAGTSLDFRIFSPVYVPVVVVLASLVDDVLAWSETAGRSALHVTLLTLGTLLVVTVTLGTVYDARQLGRSPHGYASPSFRTPLSQAVAALPARALVASNDPYRLYGVTGRQPVVLSPGKEAAGISVSPVTLDTLVAHARCQGPVYLAWWRSQRNEIPRLEPPAALSRAATLTVVADGDDGTLYSLEPAGSDTGKPC